MLAGDALVTKVCEIGAVLAEKVSRQMIAPDNAKVLRVHRS